MGDKGRRGGLAARRYRRAGWGVAAGVLLALLLASGVRTPAGPGTAGAQPEVQAQAVACEAAEILRAVDGDTLAVRMPGGAEETVRLIGIDAPESVHPDPARNTPEGREAAGHMEGLVPPGTQVWLERDVSDRDRYGRLLRYVWLAKPPGLPGTGMLNAILVANGHAGAAAYPPDTRYYGVFDGLEAAGEGDLQWHMG